jgi:hypothetical protein
VEQDVGVAVAAEALLALYLHASQKQASPFLKSMYIIANAYAHV